MSSRTIDSRGVTSRTIANLATRDSSKKRERETRPVPDKALDGKFPLKQSRENRGASVEVLGLFVPLSLHGVMLRGIELFNDILSCASNVTTLKV